MRVSDKTAPVGTTRMRTGFCQFGSGALASKPIVTCALVNTVCAWSCGGDDHNDQECGSDMKNCRLHTHNILTA